MATNFRLCTKSVGESFLRYFNCDKDNPSALAISHYVKYIIRRRDDA